MNRSAVYLSWALTLLLCLAPLVHILQRRRFQTYFVYFVAVSGFVVFNVADSISPNVVPVDTVEFRALLLVTAFALAALYPLLVLMASAATERGMLGPVRAPTPRQAVHHRGTLRLLAAAALGLSCAFFALAPPLLLRVDLWGDWFGLMVERSRITTEVPLFGWFSLFFWELPMLLVVLLVLLRAASAQAGEPAAARAWGRYLWIATPVAAFLAVAYFHVLQLAYMLAGMALAAFVIRGRLPAGLILRYGLPASVATALMYMAKTGAGFSRDALQRTGELLQHRVFEVYAWAGAVAVYVFPAEHPFLGGRSFVNFMNLFSYEQVEISTWVYPYLYAGQTGGGAPVPAIMEGWANFGWAGALGTLGVVLLLIAGITWMSWSAEPFYQALSIYLAVKMLLTWQAALWFGILAPPMVLFIPFVWAVFRLLRPPAPARPFAARPLPAPALR